MNTDLARAARVGAAFPLALAFALALALCIPAADGWPRPPNPANAPASVLAAPESLPPLPSRILHALWPTAPVPGYKAADLDSPRRFPDGSTWTLRGWYTARGIAVVDSMAAYQAAGLFTVEDLRPYPVVLVTDYVMQDMGLLACEPVLTEYARRGGGLVVMGQIGDRAQFKLDDLLGFTWLYSGVTRRHAYITDAGHPVMEGITALPKAGGAFIDYDNTIAESPLPPGATILARELLPYNRIALIAFEHGRGRVVAGPWDGLIRAYAPTNINGWDVVGVPILENDLQLNAIRWAAGWIDYDEDGPRDPDDNCPDIANPGQEDLDADGIGDACDDDDDADGVVDGLDNCPLLANADQVDTDADAQGDACDADDDNDGLPDASDTCPLEDPGARDADGDGCTDAAETLPDVVAALDLPPQVEHSLMASVDAALAALARGNTNAARGALGAFINKVEARSGKQIDAEQAAMLVTYAGNVIALLP